MENVRQIIITSMVSFNCSNLHMKYLQVCHVYTETLVATMIYKFTRLCVIFIQNPWSEIYLHIYKIMWHIHPKTLIYRIKKCQSVDFTILSGIYRLKKFCPFKCILIKSWKNIVVLILATNKTFLFYLFTIRYV